MSSPPPAGYTIGRDTAEGSTNGAMADLTVIMCVVAGEVWDGADRAGAIGELGARFETPDPAQPANRMPTAAAAQARFKIRMPGC
jgi:hypothetical protein